MKPRKQQAKFTKAVRLELIHRNWSVNDLARAICRPRNSVSLVIHERRRIPSVEAAVRKELSV
jgi:plasmid maintenance system antidote protein VapI